jgi:hypothetical protein
MKIVEVSDKKTSREFLILPLKIYKEIDAWIRPLDKDINFVFDKEKNKAFRHGICNRWILKADNGDTIGRVAAFVNRKTMNKGNDQPTGGIGFFDCINDQQAAFKLFDTCKEWLEAQEMEAMDGPINFGERDKWWGLLIDGFEKEPNYNCNYNPPYYKDFFHAYGFELYFNQFTFGRVVRDKFHPRIYQKAEQIFKDPNYHFEHLKKNNLQKYIEDFRMIYNSAWAKHGVPELSSLQAKSLMKKLKPIMDEKIIWFGYYNEEPIAFYLNIPEINQIFKYVNGKLDLIGKLKFLYHKWRGSCQKMLGLVFGVVPEFQGKGVEGALVIATAKMVQDDYHQYPFLEMNWIGDFNPKMIRVVQQVGGEVVKTHATFRKLFDESKPFKRMPILH